MKLFFHFQRGGPQAASDEPSQIRYEACQAADFCLHCLTDMHSGGAYTWAHSVIARARSCWLVTHCSSQQPNFASDQDTNVYKM